MSYELIQNATVITMNDQGTVIPRGDVLVQDQHIIAVGPDLATDHLPEKPILTDGSGMWVVPGFVQPHVHLCQTLFKGLAEDFSLLDWLRNRIWPLEAGHTESSMEASAKLGIYELLAGGTTTIMDMGTVRHTDVLFETCGRLGIRATIGKAMMERGKGMPPALRETPELCLRTAVELADRYHDTADDRLKYCFYPRFLLSVGEGLLKETVAEARARKCRLTTHASENPEEALAVVEQTKMESVRFLEKCGFLGPDVVLAHAIHLTAGEFNLLKDSGTHVVHCPSSNAKLASGTAKVVEMLKGGINVGLASDGAPCNNNHCMFTEMRLAAHMQNLRSQQPGSLPAMQAVYMATRGGAAAMGLSAEIGSIEAGKKADMVMLNPCRHHSFGPFTDPYTRLVYSMDARNVVSTWVDGKRLYHKGHLRGVGEASLMHEAGQELEKVLKVLS